MNDRIVLRKVGLVLTEDQLIQVSGGSEGGVALAEWSSGQPTQKLSSQDPNGPMDPDKSTVDW